VKHIGTLTLILLIAGSALYFAQHRKRRDAVSAGAVVDMAADWQRDLTRAPMQFTRISDEQESRIGDELAKRYESGVPLQSSELRATEKYVNIVGARVAFIS